MPVAAVAARAVIAHPSIAPSLSLAATPHIHPATYANSLEETERVARKLYSQCSLHVLQEIQLRDAILTLCRTTDHAPGVSVLDMLELTSQIHLILLQHLDHLLPEDAQTFLTGGLSQEMLQSAPWHA
jgi:hypothetical protein